MKFSENAAFMLRIYAGLIRMGDERFMELQAHFFAEVFWYRILVDHIVHGVGCDIILAHIPYSFIVACFSP